MRRIALSSLTMLLSGCGFNTWWNPPFTTGYNPNSPVSDSVNLSRARGEGVAVRPLTAEPGDIWPGPLPPPRSLQDLQRQTPGVSATQKPVPGSPLGSGRSPDPLTAPLPGSARPSGAGAPAGAPATGRTLGTGATPAAPPVDRRIIVPNGNGTSTVIHPDGRIETIPTPPQ